jgi:hypothetical protein
MITGHEAKSSSPFSGFSRNTQLFYPLSAPERGKTSKDKIAATEKAKISRKDAKAQSAEGRQRKT